MMKQTGARRLEHAVTLSWLAAALLLLTAACSGPETTDRAGPDERPEEPLQVFAAASLTQPFTELGEKFEEEHGVPVDFNFAGSSHLVSQIEQGAPAGVFASADEPNMTRVQQSGATATQPELFAANTLVIVTPPGNPAAIHSLAGLADEQVVTVICAPQVPCGSATADLAEAAGVELSPVSEENAVTDVLGKVRSGEADAGVVYRTDALGAGTDVETIQVDTADEVVNNYPIAALEEAGSDATAREFVEFVLTPEAQQILRDAGFAAP